MVAKTRPSKEWIKGKILEKYKSMSKFGRKAGIDRYDLQKMFARKELTDTESARLLTALGRTDDLPEANEITPAQVERLRNEINAMGGVHHFSKYMLDEEKLDFPVTSIYQVLDGRRKKMAGFPKRLFDYFEIK